MGVSIAFGVGFIVCLITTASVGTKELASKKLLKTMGFALNQMKIPSIPYQIQILH
jgi:hypothetical protein